MAAYWTFCSCFVFISKSRQTASTGSKLFFAIPAKFQLTGRSPHIVHRDVMQSNTNAVFDNMDTQIPPKRFFSACGLACVARRAFQMSFSDTETLCRSGGCERPAALRPRSAPCRSLPTLDLDDMTAEAVELFRCGQQQVPGGCLSTFQLCLCGCLCGCLSTLLHFMP